MFACHDLHHRGLSRAIRPDQQNATAFLNLPVQVLEKRLATQHGQAIWSGISETQVLQLNSRAFVPCRHGYVWFAHVRGHTDTTRLAATGGGCFRTYALNLLLPLSPLSARRVFPIVVLEIPNPTLMLTLTL